MRRMPDDSWRERLREAVKQSGLTERKISLSAGCGAGYVHDLLKKKKPKEPGLIRLMAICDVLGVSLSWIALGVNLSQAQEKLLRLMAQIGEDDRRLLLQMAESLRGKSAPQPLRLVPPPEQE